jgi:hypothetical protein
MRNTLVAMLVGAGMTVVATDALAVERAEFRDYHLSCLHGAKTPRPTSDQLPVRRRFRRSKEKELPY